MSEFLMPSLGADMESAILMEWHVKEGDKVTKGQVIAEVETSKGVIEIEVFEDGIVEKILVEEETECKVGTVLALIKTDTKEVTKITTEPEVKKEEIKKETKPKVEIQQKLQEKSDRIKISPVARNKANELGIDISKIIPKGEVIQLEDLELSDTKETKQAVKKAPKAKDTKDGMRQAIAAAMSKSNAEIPHYYLSTSINMSPALNFLESLNKERSIHDRILPVAILIRAVVKALKDVPELNGFWQNDSHQISKEIHPGIAIALRKGGLMTPALLNADVMSLDDTMRSLSDLITRTRSSKLKSSEMIAQTITITNLGDLGVESVYGVIYPTQLAVIGLGAIMEKPWAEDDTLSVRKVMQATVAGDHRATDGRVGAMFLDRLNKYLQEPKDLL